MYEIGIAAACSKLNRCGIGIAWRTSIATYSAKPPRTRPNTRSPGRHPVTPSPTALTSPAASVPPIFSGPPCTAPPTTSSPRFIALARTRTTISPVFGLRLGHVAPFEHRRMVFGYDPAGFHSASILD
jgi:hypothetical protein